MKHFLLNFFENIYTNFILSFILFFFIFQNSSAQRLSDTIHIKEITITEKFTPDIIGLKEVKIDSAILSQNIHSSLSEILTKNTSTFIKNYGPGRTSSSSIRGAGASHTQVLWNGININSSMLGQSDFSQTPNSFFDDISLYHGGAALSNNSGAFGGSINIMNKPKWNQKLNINVQQTYGSYNTSNSVFSLGFGNKKIQSNTRFFLNYSENNFPYKPYDNSDDLINKNSEYFQSGIMQELYYKINKKNILKTILWAQKNTTNFPGKNGNEKQNSEFFRSLIEWENRQEKYLFSIRNSYNYNYLNYLNNDLIIDSKNTELILSNFAEFNYSFFENIKLISNISSCNTKIITNNYASSKYRNNFSFSAGINSKIINEKLNILFLLKQEISDKNFTPVIPSFGIDFKLLKSSELHLKTNISRNYHLPSLNDLYWNPGGNSILVPEEGFFTETGLSYSAKSNYEKQKFSSEITGFYSLIKNNIVWIPMESSSQWMVKNLKSVESKGIEIHTTFSGEIYKIKYNFSANYSYTSAINQTEINNTDNSFGKQLIYVPFHIVNSNLGLFWNNFYINYNYSFTGKRYIYSDNSWYMPPYQLSDFSLGKNLYFKNSTFSIQGIISNIFDCNYQVINAYPMMRRNFKISLKISFHK